MADFPEGINWYAVRTRSRHEKAVAAVLEPKVAEVYLPLLKVRSRRKDRRVWYMKPAIPGYVFVHEELSAQNYPRIVQTEGAVEILTERIDEQTRLAPIPDEQIDSLKIVLAAKADAKPYEGLVVGERVEVTHGPFRGAIGRLILIKPQRNLLVVCIDVVGRAVGVEIDAADVVKSKA